MYGNPVVLILDEPNASLDAPGSAALNSAIKTFKADGNAVIIMAHRPSGIIECDLLMILHDGKCKAVGTRDEILRANLQNYEQGSGHLDVKIMP